MAQANAKKSTAKKNTKTSQATEKTQKTPRRREIGAFVCLVLGILSFIGYVPLDAVFIKYFCGSIKGIIGWGFYLLPPMLLLCSYILFFHRGRPVRFRVFSALITTVFLGALLHIFICKVDYTLSGAMFKELARDSFWHIFKSGESGLICGGVVSGVLAVVFQKLFSTVGAVILLILGLAFFAFSACNLTLVYVIDKFKNRRRLEYEPEPEPEKRKKYRPEPSDEHISVRRNNSRPEIDIPIDDPIMPEPERKKGSFFNKKAGVKRPDQLFENKKEKAGTEETEKAPVEFDVIYKEDSSEASAAASEPLTQPEPETSGADDIDIPFFGRNGEKRVMPANQGPARAETEPKLTKAGIAKEQAEIARQAEQGMAADESDYQFPPLSLLNCAAPGNLVDSGAEQRETRERLETAIRSFGINVEVSNIVHGPSVTRYEIELEAGVKLNKLTNLADDIALSLGASGVRIAPIPNKISTVGIEVPNRHVSTVYLRDIIDSDEFKNAKSKLTFAIGKNISGEAVVGNISKLPHMLVAGTTGSGKSVCLNSLILSILYKAKPDEVKFIMVDPKMVEFKIYNGIPHLLIPVVTEAKKAAGALQWAVTEMMKRYRLFSETNARDLAGYNAACRASEDENMTPLPQIVVVIDELADLMMVAAKEVEESICRVAQMGRAAGVHLVIATQSPRADVITGLMKANIPSRIALKVSSGLESRIILDSGGNAEALMGNGDMLYAPIGTSKPVRIQGTWVSDEEREAIVEFLKNSGTAEYAEDVIDQIEKAAAGKDAQKSEPEQADSSDYDELLPQAVDVVLEMGQASVSMLQRKLKLGYSRAARIVDQMEEIGVVGPFEGAKPRPLLITRQQWQEMQFINGTAPVEQINGDAPYTEEL